MKGTILWFLGLLNVVGHHLLKMWATLMRFILKCILQSCVFAACRKELDYNFWWASSYLRCVRSKYQSANNNFVSSIHLSPYIVIFSSQVLFDFEDINCGSRQPLASSSRRTPHCRGGDLLLLREAFLSGGGRLHDHSHISCNMTDTLTHKHINTIYDQAHWHIFTHKHLDTLTQRSGCNRIVNSWGQEWKCGIFAVYYEIVYG